MKKNIKDIVDKVSPKHNRQDEIQHQRQDRLRALEESKDSKGFHILNPIKAVKTNQEIKSLRKEIAAYEEKKKEKKKLVYIGVTIIVCFCLLGIIGLFEKNNNSNTSNNSIDQPAVSDIDTDPSQADVKQTDNQSNDQIDNPQTHNSIIVVKDEKKNEPDDNLETHDTDTTADDSIDSLSVQDLDLSWVTDYSHISQTCITLGNDEKATIYVSSKYKELSKDDLVILYNKDYLNVSFGEVSRSGNTFELKLRVSGKKAGSNQLVITTKHDYDSNQENMLCFNITVLKLDKKQGKVVFVSDHGDKYHYTQSCAGAGSTKTTLNDAEALELHPCKKCVK